MENIIENAWSKSKLVIKGVIIGLLVLVLQIPTFFVRNLIEEREQRQGDAISEVSSKWAGNQNITGPILVLPYWKYAGDTGRIRTKEYACFLPDVLNMESKVFPREKYRGIYKVILYSTTISISGSFSSPKLQELQIPVENVLWDEASVRIHISDTKGLQDELKIKWGNNEYTLTPEPFKTSGSEESLYAKIPVSAQSSTGHISFSSQLNLAGSGELLFTPVGKTTTVRISSAWPHPSFTGSILPQQTNVSDSGFTATWKSLAHNRSFPQQWKANAFGVNVTSPHDKSEVVSDNITTTAFGAQLFIPVNSYQKTMRSIKYAALCILLTFVAFFLIEVTNKRSVHPFQYGLIGIALVLFYTLLLSFSEYIGFNLSYLVASVFTIGLIIWFVKDLLGSGRLTSILSVVLLLIYTYVFTILQLQDYSLILGSLGLFITLAVVMHFSKKIKW